MLPIFVFLLACPAPESVIVDYRRARHIALEEAPAAPSNWKADAQLTLSAGTVQRSIEVALEEQGDFATELDLSLWSIKPRFTVSEVKVASRRAPKCDGCIALTGALDGEADLSGLGVKQHYVASATVELDARVVASRDGDLWTVSLRPESIQKLTLDLPGVLPAVRDIAGETVSQWLQAELTKGVKPFVIGEFGGEALPLRALKVARADEGIRIAMLTTARGDHRLSAHGGGASDWGLRIAQGSLVALARKEAFLAGPVSHDVVAVPTSLSVTDGRFDLGLRLWKTTGAGWWRDYQVTGSLAFEGKRLELGAGEAVQRASSPGAAVADPLAYLGEGLILSGIEDAVSTTLPVVERSRIGSRRAVVAVTSAVSEGSDLLIAGTLAFPAANRSPKPAGRVPASGKTKLRRLPR